ncbi:hypothetical protein RB653_009451 [Dictyostelium firmibasis]|uniref:RRM domain-containing protein n=1 Tax=Dictyostelium firmibasis TaxID=79012 RepID=A0AAN7U667_9MYCE
MVPTTESQENNMPDNAAITQQQQDATTSISSSVATQPQQSQIPPQPQYQYQMVPQQQAHHVHPHHVHPHHVHHQGYVPHHHHHHHQQQQQQQQQQQHHHHPHHVGVPNLHHHHHHHHPIHHGGYVPHHHTSPMGAATAGIPPTMLSMTPINGVYQPPHQLTSLYVGDLAVDVNEIILNELFSKVGRNAIASIHVCRDSNTMRSLGYAYVNFFNNHDAERALDTLNYSMVHGKPCRIMWSYRDPTKRKTNVGNIFVKNLEKGVDNAMLYDTFSSFGNILSCKVEFEKGVSKGYGYVHFETSDSAEKAIEKVNGNLILGKPINVERFVPKVERYKVENKVFFRNADESITMEIIQQELSNRFGEIESCILKSDANGKSKGLGLVEFKNQEDAQKLLTESGALIISIIDGTTTVSSNGGTIEINGKPITIDRIKSKVERFTEYRKKTTDLSLFINNIDESIDRDLIKEEFAKHGTIIGIKIVQDENGKNKGFGFISFSEIQEAQKAVESLNGFTFGSKQIQVSFSNKDNQINKLNVNGGSGIVGNGKIKNIIPGGASASQFTGYLPINRYHQHLPHPHQHINHLHHPMYTQQPYFQQQQQQQQPQQQPQQTQPSQQQQQQQQHLNGNTATAPRYPKTSNGTAPFKKSTLPQNANGTHINTNSNKSNNTNQSNGFRNKRVPNGKPRYNNNNNNNNTNTTSTPTTENTTTSVENTTLTLEFITNSTAEEATEALGSEVYSLVLTKYNNNAELAAKIAGMIINAVPEHKELFEIISNGQIQSKIEEAKSLLDQPDQE